MSAEQLQREIDRFHRDAEVGLVAVREQRHGVDRVLWLTAEEAEDCVRRSTKYTVVARKQ